MAKSLAQTQREKLASAAGLSTPEKEPKFTVKTSSPMGPFGEGDVLSTPTQIAEYYRLSLNVDRKPEEKTKLSDKQIYEAVQQVSLEGIEELIDQDIVRTEYLESLEATSKEPLDDLRRKDVLNASETAAFASQLGEQADKKFEATVNVALKGKLDWDGGPLTIEEQLVRLYGDKLLQLPVVGSRKTGQTSRKTGLSKDTVPQEYNGPTDWCKVNLGGGESEIISITRMFVEAMPHVHQMQTRRKTLKSLLTGDQLATIPAEYAEYCPPKADLNKAVLQGFADDLAAGVTRNINRISNALAYWQVKNRIDTELPEVSYALVDDTPEATAKRTKPIQMMGMITFKGKTAPGPSGNPISLSAFIRLGRFIDQCKAEGGKLNKLMDLSKVKKKPIVPTGAGTPSSVPAIENVKGFGNGLCSLYDYLERNASSIRAELAGKEGGILASEIMRAYDKLAIWGDDNNVKAKAEAYDTAQLKASAEADKAKMPAPTGTRDKLIAAATK